jgi:hypothetical protein
MNKPTNVFKVILFNDIVDSTKLWANNGNKMYRELNRIKSIVNVLLKKCNGFIIKMIGDSFMIAFDDLLDSIKFTVKFQKKLDTTKSLLEKTPQFRTGIYYGMVNQNKMLIQKCLVKDFFGSVVNIASRLESKVSDPGSIAIGIKDNRILNNILDFLKKNKYNYEIIDYKHLCKSSRLKSIRKKNITLSHKCKNIKILKGVDKNMSVLKITKKI